MTGVGCRGPRVVDVAGERHRAQAHPRGRRPTWRALARQAQDRFSDQWRVGSLIPAHQAFGIALCQVAAGILGEDPARASLAVGAAPAPPPSAHLPSRNQWFRSEVRRCVPSADHRPPMAPMSPGTPKWQKQHIAPRSDGQDDPHRSAHLERLGDPVGMREIDCCRAPAASVRG